jgi:hypothetical protein
MKTQNNMRFLRSMWLLMILQQNILLDLVCGQPLSTGLATRKLTRSRDEPVMDLMATRRRVLNWKERRLLGKQIRTIPEDVQIVIADNVEYGFSPREIAVELINTWQDNNEISNRGVLILVVMEQNRIEMEFGEGLSHIFDQDWCHEILISKALPCFRSEEYAKGLEAVVKEIQDVLKASKVAPKRRKGRWAALVALFGIGSYNMGNRRDDGNPPPPTEDEHSNGHHRRRRRNDSWFCREQPRRRRRRRETGLGGWDNWSYLLGTRAAGRASTRHAASTKTSPGPGNVNIFYGGSPTYSHESKTTEITSMDSEEGHNPLNHRQEQEQNTTRTSTTVKESSGSSPPMKPIKTTTKSSALGFKPQPFRPMETMPRRQPQRPTVVDQDQGATKTKKPPSSGLGGGASWSNVGERTNISSEKKKTASSGLGGGASWSSVESRTKPTTTSKQPNNKKENKNPAGSGGGATW